MPADYRAYHRFTDLYIHSSVHDDYARDVEGSRFLKRKERYGAAVFVESRVRVEKCG